MKSTKLSAVTLLLVLFATCFFSTPVLADHPWDIDKGTDTKGTNSIGEDNLNDDKEAVPVTTSAEYSDMSVGSSWVDAVWFVYDYLVPVQLKPFSVDNYKASNSPKHSRR